MGARELHRRLLAAGLRVGADDDGLLVGPVDRLSDEMREVIRENRDGLLRLVRDDAAALTARLIDAINRACRARGDDDAHRAALIEECVAQPLATQTDLLAHFVIEAARWVAPDPDDRVTCSTCRHHRPLAFRCSNFLAAGLTTSDVSRYLAELPQHCPGFAPRSSS